MKFILEKEMRVKECYASIHTNSDGEITVLSVFPDFHTAFSFSRAKSRPEHKVECVVLQAELPVVGVKK